MTPERMRVRIAEYLGAKWYWARISNVPGKRAKCLKFKQPEGRWYECNGDEPIYNLGLDVPDYPNDLNACHEMEQALNGNSFLISMYQQNLEKLTTPEDALLVEIKNWMFHATALQRSEAFCRTVGIWEDEPAEQSPTRISVPPVAGRNADSL